MTIKPAAAQCAHFRLAVQVEKMVVDAVGREPVSRLISLFSGKLQRNWIVSPGVV
jgi:RNase P protein component